MFVLMSDGCPHAGIGTEYNFGWGAQGHSRIYEDLLPRRIHREDPFYHSD